SARACLVGARHRAPSVGVSDVSREHRGPRLRRSSRALRPRVLPRLPTCELEIGGTFEDNERSAHAHRYATSSGAELTVRPRDCQIDSTGLHRTMSPCKPIS